MTIPALIERLESLGYSFVTVMDDNEDHFELTAVDPQGYQIEINAMEDGATPPRVNLVVDRRVGAEHWDIMFVGSESFL